MSQGLIGKYVPLSKVYTPFGILFFSIKYPRAWLRIWYHMPSSVSVVSLLKFVSPLLFLSVWSWRGLLLTSPAISGLIPSHTQKPTTCQPLPTLCNLGPIPVFLLDLLETYRDHIGSWIYILDYVSRDVLLHPYRSEQAYAINWAEDLRHKGICPHHLK